MSLQEIKEMAEKGLTNLAIARAVNLSVRQVQRLKRKLLDSSKPPKNIKDLLKILAKKAGQGDLLAVRTLLKEFKEDRSERAGEPRIPEWGTTWLTNAEKDVLMALFFRAMRREEGWQGGRPKPEEIEALARAERSEDVSRPTSTKNRPDDGVPGTTAKTVGGTQSTNPTEELRKEVQHGEESQASPKKGGPRVLNPL